MSEFYQWQGQDLLLRIKVLPRASRDEIAEVMEDMLKIRIKAAPVDGKANSHLIDFLAGVFKVPKKNIEVISGHSSRSKRLLIQHPAMLPPCISASPCS